MNKLNKAIRHAELLSKRFKKLSSTHANNPYHRKMFDKDAERMELIINLLQGVKKVIK